jgi:hypothetical protein
MVRWPRSQPNQSKNQLISQSINYSKKPSTECKREEKKRGGEEHDDESEGEWIGMAGGKEEMKRWQYRLCSGSAEKPNLVFTAAAEVAVANSHAI